MGKGNYQWRNWEIENGERGKWGAGERERERERERESR